MHSEKHYSPTPRHRHDRNEIKQEKIVTWSQEAPSPFSYLAIESGWQVYWTDKSGVYFRAELCLTFRHNNFDRMWLWIRVQRQISSSLTSLFPLIRRKGRGLFVCMWSYSHSFFLTFLPNNQCVDLVLVVCVHLGSFIYWLVFIVSLSHSLIPQQASTV